MYLVLAFLDVVGILDVDILASPEAHWVGLLVVVDFQRLVLSLVLRTATVGKVEFLIPFLMETGGFWVPWDFQLQSLESLKNDEETCLPAGHWDLCWIQASPSAPAEPNCWCCHHLVLED